MDGTRVGALLGAALMSVAVIPLSPGRGAAQVAYDSPRGRVEVLGLRRWTVRMLQDSIRHYVPGQELHDAACVVTLRDSLHFADATVEYLEMRDEIGAPSRKYLTIKLVEPEHAALVQWDVRPRRARTSLIADYAPLVLPVTDSTGEIWIGRIAHWLQFADSARRHRALVNAPSPVRSDAERVTTFLQRSREERDRQRAMSVLADDGFWPNRMAAVMVLSNFTAHDSTWWTLARALRDPNEGVRHVASVVIGTLPVRPVDWSGAVGDVRLLVGGTHLLAIQDVFELLTRTSVVPALAAALLRGNAEWVLTHLAAETPMASDAAHRLLVRLNGGRDLGRSRSAWESWILTL